MVDPTPFEYEAELTRIERRLPNMWDDATQEWGDAYGGMGRHEIFAQKILSAVRDELRATPSPSVAAPELPDQANVLPPTQQEADAEARAWMEKHGYGNQSVAFTLADLQARIEAKDQELMVSAKRWFADESELSAAAGAERQGGGDNSNSAEFDGIKQSSTAPTVEVDERAAFEAWFTANRFGGMKDSMWAAWEARAALASKPPAREAAERQSIDTPEFYELLKKCYEVVEGGGMSEALDYFEDQLIAHIDTWGGAAPAAGNTQETANRSEGENK